MLSRVDEDYRELISRVRYDYFMTVSFRCFDNLDYDKQLKYILKRLHRKLFGKRYEMFNKFLQMVIVREGKMETCHFHALVSTSPHDFDFQGIRDCLIYAINGCNTTSNIEQCDIPLLTTNHHKKSLESNKKGDKSNCSYPHNIVAIDSYEDQCRIVDYLLKDVHKNNYPIAILMPRKEGYFEFSTNTY